MGDTVPDRRNARPGTESTSGHSQQREEDGAGNAVGTLLVGRWNDAAERRSGLATRRFRGRRRASVPAGRGEGRLDAARFFQDLSLYPLLVSGQSVLSVSDVRMDW